MTLTLQDLREAAKHVLPPSQIGRHELTNEQWRYLRKIVPDPTNRRGSSLGSPIRFASRQTRRLQEFLPWLNRSPMRSGASGSRIEVKILPPRLVFLSCDRLPTCPVPRKSREVVPQQMPPKNVQGLRPSRLFALLCSCIIFTSSGCVSVSFKEPISSFQTSVDKAGVVVSTYFVELNDFERTLYFEGLLNADPTDPASEVLATDMNGNPTALLGRSFSAEGIRARTDAIALLGLYARRLGELAGTDAPARFESAAQALGTNAGNLAQTFTTLAGSGDTSAVSYAEPISKIVGSLGKMYLEEERDAAIREAVETAAPQVREVIKLLEDDLAHVVAPLRVTGLKQVLAERVNTYNQNRATWSLVERRSALAEIRSTAREYELAVGFQPTGLLRGVAEAHEALVHYARSERTPEDLAQLVSAMENLKIRLEPAISAISEIRELRRSK